ncbi:hypothetical protein PMEGAS228_33210 [Priestia megaterium]
MNSLIIKISTLINVVAKNSNILRIDIEWLHHQYLKFVPNKTKWIKREIA